MRAPAVQPAKATEKTPRTALEFYSLTSSVTVSLYFSLMTTPGPVNLWTSPEHASHYLQRADQISHRTEGEASLLEFIPPGTRQILDLGTGDGRLLALVRQRHPETEAVAVDFSPAM